MFLLRGSIPTAACCIAFTAAAIVPTARGGDENVEPQPAAVAPYADLVEQCGVFETTLRNAQWKTTIDESFDDPRDGLWAVDGNGDNRGEAKVGRVGDRNVIVFNVPERAPGQLLLGKPVSGAFAVEIIARTDAKVPCDLSLFMTAPGSGPGLQFGGQHNTLTAIWTGDHLRGFRNITQLEHQPVIEPGKWHRIRLEVSGDSVRALVDNVLLGQVPLGPNYNAAAQMQPTLYVYGTSAMVDHVQVMQLLDKPIDDNDAAFKQAFGDRTLGQIEDELAELVDLLGDSDYFVREAAQHMLLQTGRMARNPLEEIAENGSLEQQHRAMALLGQIPTPLTETPQ